MNPAAPHGGVATPGQAESPGLAHAVLLGGEGDDMAKKFTESEANELAARLHQLHGELRHLAARIHRKTSPKRADLIAKALDKAASGLDTASALVKRSWIELQ